ncbi:GNAT family N-acetyltransferase [Clostridium estertheticum]|uniref:GNAT family N-acetyltransferase n=1 Tax=Clostridium estertheticum TaxID=238834 RepID=UPI001C0E1093|nr:GNAT family protein [Clostridium estertheticum]MBU3176827.1 GNAT family N-acetyltransferase [Clostridium estertheticum]
MLIKLERFKSEEIMQLVSWVPNKEFLLQWGGPLYNFEFMGKQFRNDINEMIGENPKNLMFSCKLLESNEMVGHIQLLGIDRVNMSARVGRVLVGDKKYRGKGIGLEMVNAILDIAFNKLNLHRVDLGVFDFNESAIACYKKAGFIIEGNFRECRKIDGKYWSLINMSILEDEYRSNKNTI